MKKTKLSILLVSGFMILNCQTRKNSDTGFEWESLFNGRDLEGWYTWQRALEPTSEVPGIPRDESGNYQEPIGKNKDPLDVFTVVNEDGEPAIRISGETYGILVTEKSFKDYHLKLEFKWGEKKYPPRENEIMDSGILYHSTGPEGAWGGVWMKSFECQIMEQACGDFICVDTTIADIPAARPSPDERYHYREGAARVTFSPSQAYCVKDMDHENPMGEWNTIEIYTFGNESMHIVNGKINMHAYELRHIVNGQEVALSSGKIQIQSEGAEVFYRNIRIRSIEEKPEFQ
jgi:hypothetical protein